MNNCPVIAKKHNFGKRLMIDFALDDARIVRQRRIKQVRVERAKQRRAEASKEEAAAEEAESGKRKGRGAIQREKKRKRADGEGTDEPVKGGKGGKQGGGGGKGGTEGKVKWGKAEDEEGRRTKDLSKPYRERGNNVDGMVKASATRRAPAPADPRGAKAAGKGAGAAKKAQAAAAVRSGDAHLASLVEEVGDMMPKKKKVKRNKQKEDGLDQLVKQKYSSLFAKSGGGEGRWFD